MLNFSDFFILDVIMLLLDEHDYRMNTGASLKHEVMVHDIPDDVWYTIVYRRNLHSLAIWLDAISNRSPAFWIKSMSNKWNNLW